MAYIGANPVNGFFEKQDLTTDGSTTTFTLQTAVGSSSAILVSVGGVIQEPEVAYNLGGGGGSIIFTEAPSSTADTYVHFLGQAIAQTITDLNGTEMVLDVDADTTITADTDDQIDFKLGGSDVIAFKTTGIHLPDGEKYVGGTGDDLQLYHDGSNSYLANSTGELRLATLTSGIAIAIGHSTSEVTFGDNVTVTGNLTIGGTTNFGDFNITNVGSIALDTITNDGTDITLDSSGDIILDSAGNDIFFKAGGTTIGEFTNSSSDLVIKSSVSDKDMLFKGNDGGAAVTALTLDMSDAGAATFNDKITVGDGKLVLNSTAVTSTAAELNLLDGVSGLVQADLTKLAAVDATAAELNIIDGDTSASTVTIVDADQIILNDNGTMKQVAVSALNSYTSSSIAADDIGTGNAAVTLTTSSGNITIDAAANDSDVIFKGTDNTADITMLTLDGSDAGHATFNNAITSGAVITSGAGLVIADAGNIGSASDTDAIAIGSDGDVTLTQDLELQHDGAILSFGANDEISLTHVHDTGLLLNSTSKLQFNDASQFIQGASATVLDIAATDEIELTATLIEVVGNATVSGTLGVTGVTTSNAGVVVDNITIDGTEIDLSSGDLLVDVAGDITLDAGGGNVKVAVGGTDILDIANSSSDVIIKPTVDAKDIIFQQADGTSILEINDGAYAKFTAAAVAPEATLTDASTVTINSLTQSVSKVTLGGNRTIGLASGGVSGAFISILVIQDGTGSRTVTWNAAYEFAADTAPTLTTTANLGDLFVFRYNGAKWLEVGRNLALTLS
jgi:hypothetical protein